MALRKLNASFLKQVAENQTLMKRIETLEAERDEGRMDVVETLQQGVCEKEVEFEGVESGSAYIEPAVQSGFVSGQQWDTLLRYDAVEKSASATGGNSTRPTDTETKASGYPHPLTTIKKLRGPTPTSESRALAKAQDDLYAMLGLINPERPLRRSSSASALGSPSQSGSDRLARPPNLMPSDDGYSSFRRSSLPPDSQLAEVYNAMEADRNAVLATIDMLSSDTR
ncbi:hypothetical protein M413DRAFT_27903 [Hebeloma cylindrosporum]|uniref:Uncharacterized protein n=1 Tax=Hebeloma cylindrosporum TaxID=76867 RepID=A0A0C3CBL5_HEBCY|nr:hypothetical protein M413DRAFT_27903 [Hebeloma cylindrosporum h7]